MRSRPAISPAWKSAAYQGALLTVSMNLWTHFSDHHSWTWTLVSSAISFPLFTLVMYFGTRDLTLASEEVLDGTSREQRRAVLRAARTGKPPADPSLRVRASALVERRIADHDRNRAAPITTFTIFAGLSAVLAITSGWWYLAEAVMFAWLLISTVRYASQLRRRLATLELPPPSPAPPAKTRV